MFSFLWGGGGGVFERYFGTHPDVGPDHDDGTISTPGRRVLEAEPVHGQHAVAFLSQHTRRHTRGGQGGKPIHRNGLSGLQSVYQKQTTTTITTTTTTSAGHKKAATAATTALQSTNNSKRENQAEEQRQQRRRRQQHQLTTSAGTHAKKGRKLHVITATQKPKRLFPTRRTEPAAVDFGNKPNKTQTPGTLNPILIKNTCQ